MKKIMQAALSPAAVWVWALRLVLRKLPVLSYKTRLEVEAVVKPQYGYCIYHAAVLAKKLGHRKISILEFGVAAGKGLLAIEWHVSQAAEALGMEFEVYGFDLGSGLPKPRDYRDLPYHWQAGFFSMRLPSLEPRLKYTKLVIGDVRETCRDFLASYSPAPIGVILWDLDFYSSTKDSFQILDGDQNFF